MPRSAIIILTVIIILSIALVTILFVVAKNSISYNQNFERVFRNDVLQEARVLDIKQDTRYIAGVTKENIYLGSKTSPLNLLIVNSRLTDSQHVLISIDTIEKNRFLDSRILVDSPLFYLKEGDLQAIYKGTLSTWKAFKFIDNTPTFTQVVPISLNSMAIQTVIKNEKTKGFENIVGRIRADSPRVKLNSNILEKQIDGYYSTLGIMRYSKELKQLVFAYFYRNEYILLDTNLNVLHNARTIDTVSHIQVKPIKLSDNSFTLASPPAVVNSNIQIWKKWLFVHSNLMAANENKINFDHSSVIDIYDLVAKKYMFSFYLPDHHNLKIENFKISDQNIIVQYSHYIVCYKLRNAYFKTYTFH